MLIAPLSANSLAGIAAGLCPGLGLSVVRAWDTTEYRRAVGADMGDVVHEEVARPDEQRRKMILVAPAMNTQMYLHPLTEQHLNTLRSWDWMRVLKPVEKLLACGDMGVGGMMEVDDIVREVVTELGWSVEKRQWHGAAR
jgi:phosphopantothenoylcysteine decarboxylase